VHQKRGDKTPLEWLFIVKKKTIAINCFAFFCLREGKQNSPRTHPSKNPWSDDGAVEANCSCIKTSSFFFLIFSH
jgi:hypothetical protein